MVVVRIVSFCGDACCIINIPSTRKTLLVYFNRLNSVSLYENELWAKWLGISKTSENHLSRTILRHYEWSQMQLIMSELHHELFCVYGLRNLTSQF